MSIGYGGYADLAQTNDTFVIYVYCCYNVNNDDYKYFMNVKDGELLIFQDAFVEPEIHEKLKRMPSGRKRTIIKRVKRDVPFDELFYEGKIKVKNASGTWKTSIDGIDVIALEILSKLFNQYQETGEIPAHIGLYS